MEETIINEPTLFQVLVSSPTTYIVLLIIGMTIYQLKNGRCSDCPEKSSPKSKKANKTLSPSKPKRARKNGKYVGDNPKTPKNEAWEGGKAPKKKTPAKKTPSKKAVKKRTPKKGGK